jgi:hypothetical protein
MVQCDVHPHRSSRFYLEHHGQCYNMCSLYELDRLVGAVRTGGAHGDYTYHTLPACGHDAVRERGTWWRQIPGIEDNDYAEEARCPQCCHMSHEPHACTTLYPGSKVACNCRVGMASASASVPNTPATGMPQSAPTATMTVALHTPSERLRNALLHVLFATQDLYNDDHSARYERWRNWAISWLREVTNGVP